MAIKASNDVPVTVVIVNFNAGDYLAQCLEALVAQSFGAFKAIVIDNASSDASLSMARDRVSDSRITFRPLSSNIGFAAANNLAVRETDTPWIATLNPDAFPDPRWLASMMEAIARYPAVPMFGSKQLDAAAPERFDGAGDSYSFLGISWRGGYGKVDEGVRGDYEVFAPCAAAALYKHAVFIEQGGFDEDFFCFMEDVDLAFRIRLAGGRCMQISEAVVRHVGGGSGGRNRKLADRLGARNRVWTFVKGMPGWLLWACLPGHLAASFLLGAVAVLQGRSTACLVGFAQGIAGIPRVWRSRRLTQARRTVSVPVVARALTWSLSKLAFREISPL